jgi:hypothetical protein
MYRYALLPVVLCTNNNQLTPVVVLARGPPCRRSCPAQLRMCHSRHTSPVAAPTLVENFPGSQAAQLDALRYRGDVPAAQGVRDSPHRPGCTRSLPGPTLLELLARQERHCEALSEATRGEKVFAGKGAYIYIFILSVSTVGLRQGRASVSHRVVGTASGEARQICDFIQISMRTTSTLRSGSSTRGAACRNETRYFLRCSATRK